MSGNPFPTRRFDQRDVIGRAAIRLADDPDPVRAAAAVWLRDVAVHFDATPLREIEFAANVATPVLTSAPAAAATPTT